MHELEISQITLPYEAYRLEEINLPMDLVSTMAGKTITVEVRPEQGAGTMRLDKTCLPRELPVAFDPHRNAWNDYRPLQVSFADSQGRKWRIPRHWLSQGVAVLKVGTPFEVAQEITWMEELNLP